MTRQELIATFNRKVLAGTATEEDCLELLEETGLELGEDDRMSHDGREDEAVEAWRERHDADRQEQQAEKWEWVRHE